MPKKVLSGEVLKQIDSSTVSVSVVSRILHSFYGKVLNRKKKYIVHLPEGVSVSHGQAVDIEECPPVSKRKSWVVKSVI